MSACVQKRWHIGTSFFVHHAQKCTKKQKTCLLDMPIAKDSAGGNWKKKHTQEAAHFFDLFNTLGGEKGWDLSSVKLDYIVWCFKNTNTPAILMLLLSKTNSQKEMNCDITKAIGGTSGPEVSGLFIGANRNMSKSKGWTLQSSLLMLWMEKTRVNNQTTIDDKWKTY